MSAADETVQTPPDEGGDSRSKLSRSGKEKKKRFTFLVLLSFPGVLSCVSVVIFSFIFLRDRK